MRSPLAAVLLACCSPVPPVDNPPPPPPGPMPTSCAVPSVADVNAPAFVEISEHSGIQLGNFTPSPSPAIPINDHSRLAFVDLDGDGFDDIVMHSLFPNAQAGIPFEHLVFLNQHDGTFKDVSTESGLRTVQAGFFAFGDFDNDGDEDAFAGLDIALTGHTSQVLLNDGHGHFTPLANAGVERLGYSANAVLADFNGDGKLDLFSGNGQTSYAARNAMLYGNGDGTFTDVTATALLSVVPSQPSNGLVACDFNNDGFLDIFVSTYGVSVEQGWDQLWVNTGDGRFVNLAQEHGFNALATGNYFNSRTGFGVDMEPAPTLTGGNGFGIDCGDVNGDGYPDIWLAQISHADGSDASRLWSDPTELMINQGPDAGFTFKNEFLARGLSFNEGDIDAAMIDYDNDGLIDLSVTRTDKYESGYTTLEQKGWFGLYHQKPDGTFESAVVSSGINAAPVTAEAPNTARMKAGQNLAWADIDHDGDADLLVGGRDQGGGRPNFLFENKLGEHALWLGVQLKGDGQHVPLDAFGARVTLRVGDRVLMRERKSSRGTYDSIDGSSLLFGLGDVGACTDGVNQVQLEVRWGDGRVETYGPDAFSLSTYVLLTYGQGIAKI